MKEATGELNMTIVVAMLVAALASFFYFSIWPKIGQSQNTDCQRAVCEKKPETKGEHAGQVKCTVKDKDGTVKNEVWCKYKG